MNIQYSQIKNHRDRYEAAYSYIADTFGQHTPYMMPDLVSRLVTAITRGVPEHQFRTDAETMFSVWNESE